MGRRLPLAAVLAPFGALAAHAAAYAVAPAGHHGHGHGHGDPHAHLGTVAAVAVPAALVVVAWLACGRRASGRPLPPVRLLAAAQAAVFAANEVAERAVAGIPVADLAAAPAVRLGLAAQVAAAAAVVVAVRLARAARWVVAAALARRADAPGAAAPVPPADGPRPAPAGRPPFSPATRRGPPAVVAAA